MFVYAMTVGPVATNCYLLGDERTRTGAAPGVSERAQRRAHGIHHLPRLAQRGRGVVQVDHRSSRPSRRAVS